MAQYQELADVIAGADGTHDYYFSPVISGRTDFQYQIYGGDNAVGGNTGCTLSVFMTLLDDGTLAADVPADNWEDVSWLMMFAGPDTADPTDTETGYTFDVFQVTSVAKYIRFRILADPNDINTCNWRIQVRSRYV